MTKSLIDIYIEFCRDDGSLKNDTIHLYELSLHRLNEYFSDITIPIKRAKAKDLDSFINYLTDKNLSASAINQTISAVKGFYRNLSTTYNTNDPSIDLSYQKSRKKSHTVPPHVLEKFRNQLILDDKIVLRNRLILLFMIEFELNSNELRLIKYSHVTRSKQLISIKFSSKIITIPSKSEIFEPFSFYLKTIKNRPASAPLFCTKTLKTLGRPFFVTIFKAAADYYQFPGHSLLSLKKSSKYHNPIQKDVEKISPHPHLKNNLQTKSNLIFNRYEIQTIFSQSETTFVASVIDHDNSPVSHDYNTAIDKIDSLKVIKISAESTGIKTIETEYEILSQLSHPNIRRALDFGRCSNEIIAIDDSYSKLDVRNGAFIITEYFNGSSLNMYANTLSLPMMIDIAGKILRTLLYIHSNNILHLDISPNNILLLNSTQSSQQQRNDTLAEIKLIDFGYASNTSQTHTSARGTAHFIAPEFINSTHADERSDLYSVGKTLYFLLTGCVASDKISTFEHSNLEIQFKDFVLTLCHDVPENRFSSAQDALNALSHMQRLSSDFSKISLPTYLPIFDVNRRIDSIIKSFRDKLNAPLPTILHIMGDHNFGKTSFLAYIMRLSALYNIKSHTLDFKTDSGIHALGDTLLKNKLSIQPFRDTLFSGRDQEIIFEEIFQNLIACDIKILLIDDIDHAGASALEALEYIIDRATKESVRLQICVTSITSFTLKHQNWKGGYSSLTINCQALTPQQLAESLEIATCHFFSEDLLKQIILATKGQPGYILTLLGYLNRNKYLMINKFNQIQLQESYTKKMPLGIFKPELTSSEAIAIHLVSIGQSGLPAYQLRVIIGQLRPDELPLLNTTLKSLSDKCMITIQSSTIGQHLLLTELALDQLNSPITSFSKTSSITLGDIEKAHHLLADELSFARADILTIAYHRIKSSEFNDAYDLLKEKAHYQCQLGFYKDALNSISQLDPFTSKLKKSIRFSFYLFKASLTMQLRQFDIAEENLEIAETLFSSKNETFQFSIAMAQLKLRKNNPKDALKSISGLSAKESSFQEILDIEMIRWTAQNRMENYKKTIIAIRLFLKTYQEKLQPSHFVLINQSLGFALIHDGQRNKALPILSAGRHYAEDCHDHQRYIQFLINIGTVHYFNCAFTDAITEYKQALKHPLVSTHITGKATILMNLGAVYHRLGQLCLAIDYYQKSATLFKHCRKTSKYQQLLLNIGFVYVLLGDFSEAQSFHNLVKSQDRDPKGILLGQYKLLNGKIFELEGKLENACKCFESAGAIFRNAHNAEYEFIALAESTWTLLKLNDYSGCEDRLNTMLRIGKSVDNRSLHLRFQIRTLLFNLNQSKYRPSTLRRSLKNIIDDDVFTYDSELQLEFHLTAIRIYQALADDELIRFHIGKLKDLIFKMTEGLPTDIQRKMDTAWSPIIFNTRFQKSSNFSLNLMQLFELITELGQEKQIHNILSRILDASIQMSGAHSGYLILVDDNGFSIKLAKSGSGESLPTRLNHFSRSIVRSVIKRKAPIILDNAADNEQFQKAQSVISMELKSILVLPLCLDNKVTGVLYVENRKFDSVFTDHDKKLLTLFSYHAATTLDRATYMKHLERSAKSNHVKLQVAEKVIDTMARRSFSQYQDIIGHSAPIRKVLATIDRIARSDVSVLITGDSGTGKELTARAIHQESNRKSHRFVAENVAALTDSLLESELFGYRKGAFTGATSDRKGLLEVANGGTLFLDEIGDMSPRLQTTLLRFLQTGEYRRIGDSHTLKSNVRLITATNKNLIQMVKNSTFRDDLYYRINVVGLKLPALRSRKMDIPDLVHYFISQYNSTHKTDPVDIEPNVLTRLKHYDWPGNVRELENEVKRLIVLRDGKWITESVLNGDPRF